MRTLSTTLLREHIRQETSETILLLVELTHPDFASPLRYVRDWQAVTSGGLTYQPRALEITLPDEEAERLPVVTLVLDNVEQDAIAALRAVTGLVSAALRLVLASAPDTVEIEVSGMEVWQMSFDDTELSLTLGVEPILDAQFGHRILSPANAPGLF